MGEYGCVHLVLIDGWRRDGVKTEEVVKDMSTFEVSHSIKEEEQVAEIRSIAYL